MLRMRHSPVSCVSTISCVLMYFSGLPSSYFAVEMTQAVSRLSNVTRSGPRSACRRRCARRKPRQEGGQSVATNPCGSHR